MSGEVNWNCARNGAANALCLFAGNVDECSLKVVIVEGKTSVMGNAENQIRVAILVNSGW